MKKVTTPYGNEAFAFDEADIFVKAAKGLWQMSIAIKLATDGYVTDMEATGSLKGNAASYRTKYDISYRNVINRIKDILPYGYTIFSGPTGPKGGFGYWIADTGIRRDDQGNPAPTVTYK
jgi:ribosomal protein S8